LIFAACFLTGILVMVSGFVHDAVYGHNNPLEDPQPGIHQPREDEPPNDTARFLEVGGLALCFGAIFGAAGWQFYRRLHEPEDDAQPPAAGAS
jgi:hypothetical protein